LAHQATVVDSGPGKGFFSTLAGLWFGPGETFLGVVRRPAVWAVLLALIALNAAFTAAWLGKVDLPEFVKAQMEERGQMEKIPAESRGEAVEKATGFTRVIAWVGAVAGPPIYVLVVAGVLFFVFRFFYASEMTFRQAMAIVGWSALAVSIVALPLAFLTLQLKGDWTVPPQEALQANPTVLVEKAETPKPLYALLGSIDLFSFWQIALLAIGFGVASRRKAGSALWGILVPWAVIVLIKIGFSFLR